MQETMEFWKAIALHKPVETGIYCRARQDGTLVYEALVTFYVTGGKRKSRRVACATLEDARAKRKEFQRQYQVRKGEPPKGKYSTYVSQLKERIAQLEQELEDYKATLEVMSDKELYEAVTSPVNMDELCDESEINWNV